MSTLIDIEKSAYRNIKSGLQYDNLFPPADLLDKIVYRDGNVKDTVKTMRDIVMKNLDDTKLIAKKLKGKTLEETCHNIWKFLYSHCQYKLDEQGLEQLRRPARAWHDRVHGIDCDCYSIFASSILTNLDIPHGFRITKYDNDWQHVYVIVPKPNGDHYTIDCVAHHFDYEKPFTDKIDYHMTQLNGIPIAVLSGLGNTPDDDLYGILSGVDFAEIDYLEGLGRVPSSEQELTSIYNHLVKTRDYIQENPNSVITSGGAAAHLQMLNYAIDNWNTPNRDAALEALEKEEERWNEHNGVSGLAGDDDEINGLGASKSPKKFFSKIKEAVKKVGQGVKNVAKKIGKAIVKYNPLSLAVRGGFLLAMKINLLDMAGKLYPAYLSEAEAKAKGISSEKWQKAKNAIAKIENLFVNKLQGRSDKLKSGIVSGRAKKQFHGFGELGEPATIASVIASSVPLIAAYNEIKKAGLQGLGEEGEEKVGDVAKAGFIQLVKSWWKKAFGKENAVSSETISDADKAPNEKAGEEEKNTSLVKSDKKEDDGKPEGEGAWAKFKTFAKENPVPVAIGGAAVVTGVALAIRHVVKSSKKKKSPQGLSGHNKKKNTPAHNKIKTIKLK